MMTRTVCALAEITIAQVSPVLTPISATHHFKDFVLLAYDENTQFIFHEQMIRRMNDNLFFTRSDLPGNKWSSIAELTRAHEEYIDCRRRVLTGLFDVPHQERHILLPDEFREFFAKAKAIEWLNLEGEPR